MDLLLELPRINTNWSLLCIFLYRILVVNDSCFISTLVFAFNVFHYCIQCVLLLVLANDLMSVASVQYGVCVVSLRFSGIRVPEL